jgi:hypothetical protein
VAPGATVTIDWTAVAHDFATRNGEQCVRDRTLPAARYRFAVRAYGSIVDASANRAGRSVTKDFTLPATGDAVDVELAGDASPACDADPSEPAPACTATQAREQACGLGEPLSFAWEGGLAFSYDEVRLEPAARYVRTRHYTMSQAQQPSLSCAVAVPRCSRDSRVATTGDVARAMALPDVAAAFGPDAPLFGENARAHDGAVLVVRRADGKSVAIGPDCHSDPNVGLCGKPLTDGLRELERVLVTLDAQGLPDPACANFR